MYKEIKMFQPLYSNGLIDMDGVNSENIDKTSFSKLLDIYDEVSQIVAGVPSSGDMHGKVFCASNSLSGAPSECFSEKCRLLRVEELSKFSALFGENVLCHNFLADISPSYGHAPNKDNSNFRNRVITDIRVLYQLKDLISSGIVRPYTTPKSYCLNCFTNKFLGENTSKTVGKAMVQLERKVHRDMDIYLIRKGSRYTARCVADESILPHPQTHILNEKVTNLFPDSVVRSMSSEGGVLLNKEQKKKLYLTKFISKKLISEAVYQKSLSKLTGGTILTHSTSEIGALKSIESDSYIHNVNSILAEHWNIIVPYAEQLSISTLVKLREREPESFIRFRHALEGAVADAFADKKSFTKRNARELYSDVIEPNLSNLEQKTKLATKDLVKKPLTVMAGIGAVLGVGAYSGMLSGDLALATKALGISKVVYDGVTSTIALSDVTKEIKQENYYYLWKMKRTI